ncbi:MAG TPA: SHOCT domain-containing protein [Solirubrobacteraceae bacterium]|nr:SHOCT domain-containing protein [Solirubrobacteraceae bacterium]
MSEREPHSVAGAPGGGEAPAAPPEAPPESQTEPLAETEPRAGDDTETRPARARISRGRLIWVNALIGVTTILAVIGIMSIWANRLLFNPDNWENTSTQLLQNQDIRNATSNYIVDQLYANVDVAGLIKQGLPTQFQALAGPAAGALRNAAVQGVDLALTRPRIQSLWATANRAADQAFIALVEGGKGNLSVKQGVVTLNLAGIVDNIASRLGLPSDIGSKLPPTIGNLTIIKSDQIKVVQNAGNAVKGLALWLTILVPLLYAAAILLARGYRRRTLMTVGSAIVLAGVLALLARSILKTQIVNSIVSDASVRPAANAVLAIGTQMITEIAGAFIFVGIILVLAGWFAGPARLATAGRRVLAPYLRDQPAWVYATTTTVMVLVFIWNPIPATGKPAGIIVFLLLALLGTELLRRQTAVEFPDAQAGEATASIRARWQGARERRSSRRGHDDTAATTPMSLPQQLEQLENMRDRGAITQEEYDSAKASLLQKPSS